MINLNIKNESPLKKELGLGKNNRNTQYAVFLSNKFGLSKWVYVSGFVSGYLSGYKTGFPLL